MKLISILVIGILFLGGIVYALNNRMDSSESAYPSDTIKSLPQEELTKMPENILIENTDYTAVIKTNFGDIAVDLFETETPTTVNNFVKLSQEGFYNGTRSHRVINGFMLQFGDPLTKDLDKKAYWGTGGPGYKFADENFVGDYTRGTLAMANSGPNTNGSQFFIMHQDYPLPKNYVIFGRVLDESSLSVVDKIAEVPVTLSNSGETSAPTADILIESIEILTQ